MGYVAAAYAAIVAGLGYYWWTLLARHSRLSRQIRQSVRPDRAPGTSPGAGSWEGRR